VVVPVYKSEECLEALIEAIGESLTPANLDYEVILVNDCSPDSSWKVIEGLCQIHPKMVGISWVPALVVSRPHTIPR